MSKKTMIGVIVVLVVLAGSARWFFSKETPVKLPERFSADYPDDVDVNQRTVQAAHALESVIYGRMVDPEAAAKRLDKIGTVIKRASVKHKVPEEFLAALIYLESGADPYAQSGSQAAGIAQMIGATAKHYGLRINPKRAQDLLMKRRRAKRQLQLLKLVTLADFQKRRRIQGAIADIERKLRLADERFNPHQAIPAAARYLADHFNTFGRWDFAFAAYHAGQGNIQRVVGDYIAGSMWAGSVKATITSQKLSWAKIFFDASPSKHPNTNRRLWSLKDDSRTYWFRILAANNVLHLWQMDRAKFRQLVRTFKAPAAPRRWELALEPRWYPPGSPAVTSWQTWEDLSAAYTTGQLVHLPTDPRRFGFRVADNIGLIASPQARPLYRGLTPEMAGLLMYLASAVRRESQQPAAWLQVNSLVRSVALQRRFVRAGLSPAEFSTHCAGVALDIAPPSDGRVHRALQYVLEDLRLRGDICYVHEQPGRKGDHYHITLAPASRLKFATLWQPANQYWLAIVGRDQRLKQGVDRSGAITQTVFAFTVLWLIGAGLTGRYLSSRPGFRRWPTGLAVASLLWPVMIYFMIDRSTRRVP